MKIMPLLVTDDAKSLRVGHANGIVVSAAPCRTAATADGGGKAAAEELPSCQLDLFNGKVIVIVAVVVNNGELGAAAAAVILEIQ